MRIAPDFRHNNMDFLRLFFAFTVYLIHIGGISGIPSYLLFSRFVSADVAVKGFFVISGLLIYRSYTRSSSLKSYFEKRVRRIYPAYFTTVVLSAVLLCFVSNMGIREYFSSAMFWKYLGVNLIFLNFIQVALPGVFASNPWPQMVNGALWTLKLEVAFYLLIPVIFYLNKILGSKIVISAMCALSLLWKDGFAFLAQAHSSNAIFGKLEHQFPGQLVYFGSGILMMLYFEKLRLHYKSILAITACAYLVDRFVALGNIDFIWLFGVVFLVGFGRYIGNFSRYGDISYGLYIVHFPVLQTLVALNFVRFGSVRFFFISTSCVLAAAILMWYLVEKPFLSHSSHYGKVEGERKPVEVLSSSISV